MQKKILIIGAGEMQVPIIHKAKKLGLYVLTVDKNIDAVGNKYADIALEIDTIDRDRILEAAVKYEIDAILTTSDYPVKVVAFISQKINLHGPSIGATEIATNKYLLRKKLQNSNIVVPLFWNLRSENDIIRQKNEYNYPLIIKPVDSSASRGVRKINCFDELVEGYREAKKFSLSGEVVLEEYIEGNEYSIESLTQNGKTFIIAITEKQTNGSGGEYFVEDRHIIPALLTEKDEIAIKEMVECAVSSIGLDNSASHTEIKLSKKGPIIIEIGARLGGDYITSDLVHIATGVDMLKNACLLALGEKIQIQKTQKLFSGIQFINSENYKAATKKIEIISNRKDYVRSEIKEYQNKKLTNSLDRLGYFICKSETRKGLYELLNVEDK